MKLWLARHAAPLIEAGICYGSLDIEADAANQFENWNEPPAQA